MNQPVNHYIVGVYEPVPHLVEIYSAFYTNLLLMKLPFLYTLPIHCLYDENFLQYHHQKGIARMWVSENGGHLSKPSKFVVWNINIT